MSTVIAFPEMRTAPPRREQMRHATGDAQPSQARVAEIVILPVVRIERHVSALPGPVPAGGIAASRPR